MESGGWNTGAGGVPCKTSTLLDASQALFHLASTDSLSSSYFILILFSGEASTG